MKFKKTIIGYKGRATYAENKEYYDIGNSVIYSQTDNTTTTKAVAAVASSSVSTKAYAEGEKAANNAVNAYSLQSFSTNKYDTAGHWNATVWYVNYLFDGLTIAIRNITGCYVNGEGYNTLNINGLGAKLVWKSNGVPLGNELDNYTEMLLVYREDAGLFDIPNPNLGELESDEYPSGTTVTSGWVLMAVGSGTGGGGYVDLSNYYTKSQVNTLIEVGVSGKTNSVFLTQAEYDAIAEPDSSTLYRTTDTSRLFYGDFEIGGVIVPRYNFYPSAITCSSEAQTVNLSARTNSAYTFNTAESWLSINPLSGTGNNEHLIMIQANPTQVARTGSITAADKTITVTQAGIIPYVMVTPTGYTSSSESGTTSFTVSSNTSNAVTVNDDWLSVDSALIPAGNVTVNVTIERNNTLTARTGTISIPPRTFTVNQAALSGVPYNEIWYTSSDGNIVTPYSSGTAVFGANIINNIYSSGQGIITFNGNVTSIGKDSFRDCSGLTEITMPNSVTSIGKNAFLFCSGMTTCTISNRVTSIGESAFYHCYYLTGITIPDSVSSIGDYAFGYCSRMTNCTIGSSVTYIGDAALFDCTSLNTLNYNGTMAQWNRISKGTYWKQNIPTRRVHCTDGDVAI